MRIVLLAFAILLASPAARAATAYEALRVLGKQKSEAILDNVTEVRGDKGVPQPRVWRILVNDAAGRGGAKEFSVTGSRVTGEQAAHGGGAPMNMSQLNLDSDGVHTVAEREAKKVAFAYDHVSYVLRAGSKGGSPVWEVRLSDEKTGDSAMLNIAATTGNVLATEGLVKRARHVTALPAPPPVPEPAYAPAPRYQPEPEERVARSSPRGINPALRRASDETNEFLDRAGNRISNHLERRGRQIGDFFHNLFTGDRRDTAGPHHPHPDAAPPPARERNDSDYVRPSRVRD